ncbi:helix-turn-helix domain-containing protein [Paenibacillus sp. P25]|nr:helix-turn-helix domain-containing protein [Paenibacillus sp. P25]
MSSAGPGCRRPSRLLSGTSHTVSEIARMVGYSEVNTFSRIFKKFEGVTPGKFKELG